MPIRRQSATSTATANSEERQVVTISACTWDYNVLAILTVEAIRAVCPSRYAAETLTGQLIREEFRDGLPTSWFSTFHFASRPAR